MVCAYWLAQEEAKNCKNSEKLQKSALPQMLEFPRRKQKKAKN